MIAITAAGMASVFHRHEAGDDAGSYFLGIWTKLDGGLRGVAWKKGRLIKYGQRKPACPDREHRDPRG